VATADIAHRAILHLASEALRAPTVVGSSNTRPSARTGTPTDLGWRDARELWAFRGYVVNRWIGEVLSSVIADVGRERRA
jgi:hypothetical protein